MSPIEMRKKNKNLKEPSENYQMMAMSSKFSFEIEDKDLFQHLSDSKKRLIQTIWEKEQSRRGGKLHEGTILSAIEFDSKKLVGQFVPYKYFLAQLCDPSLKPDLKITPVSLSGITYAMDNIIIAKRAPWVAQYPEKYELAPSGGIQKLEDDKIQIKQQLLSELKEEIGVKKEFVKKIKFFSIVEDVILDTVELCAEIYIDPIVLLSSTPEYSQVISLPKEEIEDFVKQKNKDFVPLSLFLLKLQNMIK